MTNSIIQAILKKKQNKWPQMNQIGPQEKEGQQTNYKKQNETKR